MAFLVISWQVLLFPEPEMQASSFMLTLPQLRELCNTFPDAFHWTLLTMSPQKSAPYLTSLGYFIIVTNTVCFVYCRSPHPGLSSMLHLPLLDDVFRRYQALCAACWQCLLPYTWIVRFIVTVKHSYCLGQIKFSEGIPFWVNSCLSFLYQISTRLWKKFPRQKYLDDSR